MRNMFLEFATVAVLLVGATANAQITTAFAPASGGEVVPQPTTPSPGIGDIEIYFDAANHKLTVDGQFQGLNGKSAAMYIHCCGKKPFNAMTQAFSGFPVDQSVGQTDPTYVYRTDDTKFWDPQFLKDKVTTTKAEEALSEALRDGTASISIWSKGPGAQQAAEELRGPFSVIATRAEIADTKGRVTTWAADPAGRVFMKGVPINDTLTCNKQSDRCVIPVYARTYAQNASVRCESRIDFYQIEVKKKKTRIIWLLVNGEVGDQTEYRFSQILGPGVKIGEPANPTGSPQHDLTKDFDSPGEEFQDSRRFKWISVAGRVDEPFNYTLTVDRWDGSKWIACKRADPRIVNRN